MNITERLARYETAQEALGMLIAARAELIYRERKKAVPDTAKIATWTAEQEKFAAKEDALRFDDTEDIERVITECGGEVREIYAK